MVVAELSFPSHNFIIRVSVRGFGYLNHSNYPDTATSDRIKSTSASKSFLKARHSTVWKLFDIHFIPLQIVAYNAFTLETAYTLARLLVNIVEKVGWGTSVELVSYAHLGAELIRLNYPPTARRSFKIWVISLSKRTLGSHLGCLIPRHSHV